MKTTRILGISLAVFLVLAAAAVFTLRGSGDLRESYPLSFVVLSDNHNELRTLSQTVERINRLDLQPNFVVTLGDNVDNLEANSYTTSATASASLGNYFDYARILDGLKAPHYFVIGNHDYHNVARFAFHPEYFKPVDRVRNRPMEILYDAWKMPYRWYCVDRDGYRLLFLDWNGWAMNLNEFADPQGEFRGRAALARFLAAQEKWVRDRVNETDKKVLIFTHFTDYGPGNNRAEFLLFPGVWEKVLASLKGRVIGIFYGHRHQQKLEVVDGIPRFMINSNSVGGSCAQVVINKAGEISVRQIGPVYRAAMEFGPDSLAPLGEDLEIVPYIREMKPGEAEIVCKTQSDKRLALRCDSSRLASAIVDAKPTKEHLFRLSSLMPDREYRYQLGIVSTTTTQWLKPVQTFRTIPREKQPTVRFAVYGSSQSNPTAHQIVLNAIDVTNPAFLLHTGGMTDRSESIYQWERQFLTPASIVTSRMPVFATRSSGDIPAKDFHKFLISEKEGPDWYSFRSGPCEFFVMDCAAPFDNGSDQYIWLSRALAESKAPWKIVVTYDSPYSSGPHGRRAADGRAAEASVQSFRDEIEPLLIKNGVRVVFGGYDHDYEHSFKEGIHYFTLGGGGAPLYEKTDDPFGWLYPFSIRIKSALSFALVEADASQLRLTAKDIDGAPIDIVDISARMPAGR